MNKKIFLSCLVVISLVGCSEKSSDKTLSTAANSQPRLEDGAYLLNSAVVTIEGIPTDVSRDQLKIYSQQRFAYAFYNHSTGKVDAGAGKAVWNDGVLTEIPLVNHAQDLSGLSFNLDIRPNEDGGFSQAIKNMRSEDGVLYDLEETWAQQSKLSTPFDGLWKLFARVVDGTPIENDFAETKMIGGGHFIWFHRYSSKSTPVMHFGYGELSADMNNRLATIESTSQSSYPNAAGQSKALQLSLVDKDTLQQSFTENGAVYIYTYHRM